MLLSKPQIERHMADGNITIDPFVPENLGSAQMDVTLGQFFYREMDLDLYSSSFPSLYNPYDEKHVCARFYLDRAVRHSDWVARGNAPLIGVAPEEELIVIQPGEMVLAHTQEFIGSLSNHITTQMKARSSIGRNFLTVCACAGQGDVGFAQRWTFEIHNRNRMAAIPLIVGRRIAQILFFDVEPVDASDVYGVTGKYQNGTTLEQLKTSWRPEMMLPRMFADRESRRARGE